MAAAPPRRVGPAAIGRLAGDPRAQLAEVQRARIVVAAIEAVGENGYAGLTIADVIARARISRRTFYEVFASRDDCFLAAFDTALEQLAGPVVAAYRGEDDGRPATRARGRSAWRERIAAALTTALALFDERPALARLLVVETLAAGPPALARRAAVVDALVRAVDAGRDAARGSSEPGPLAGEAVVGAVLAVLHGRLREYPRHDSLLALAGPLMNAIVLPYLGPAAAARELRRPAPSARGPVERGDGQANPMHGLEMRFTYRTLRVLAAVGELAAEGTRPSNRAVADAAGVSDFGQMSKLLRRLQRLGLVENAQRAHGEPFRGAPNRWRLTDRGAAVCAVGSGYPGVEPG